MSSENGNHPEQEASYIVTTDEEGKKHYFELIDQLEVDGQQYGLLLYLGDEEKEAHADMEEDDEEGYEEEFVIMKIIQEENGDNVFESIEDDEEFERILALVEQMGDDDEE